MITTEFVFQKPSFSVPLSFDRESLDVKPYPAVEESASKARLYRRAGTHAQRELVSADEWSFARCSDGKTKTVSNTGKLARDERGALRMFAGYKALVVIENYGGQDLLSELNMDSSGTEG